jgi:hypothetical protein
MVGGFFERLKAAGGAVVGFMGKVIVVIILLIIAGGVVSWKHNHPKQAQATTDSLMTAGASTITWASNAVTSATGGSAATVKGVSAADTIWVENKAPGYWPVAKAVAAWNKGLTSVQLKVGACRDGALCIRVSEASYLPEGDNGGATLGRTTQFLFGAPSVKFNREATHRVPRSFLAVAACHELGHALGQEHRDARTTCMQPVVGRGVPARPDADDFADVNKRYRD